MMILTVMIHLLRVSDDDDDDDNDDDSDDTASDVCIRFSVKSDM